MAENVVIYAIIHQPRRLKLPAQPLPASASTDELERALFDDTLNRFYLRKVARYCYWPASELFLHLVENGMRLSLGFSVSFLEQAARWDEPLLERFRTLVAHPNVDLVCVEPYHSFIFYVDITLFQRRMEWARNHLQRLFGKRPQVAHVTEMFMSREVYRALEQLGFKAALMEGRYRVLDWRSPAYLYRHGDGKLALMTRHKDLSDDVGYRFSQKTWPGYPLRASDWAQWIRDTAGDVVLVGWDFETFGEHHYSDSGIFEFLRWLPGELQYRGVEMLTVGSALERFRKNVFPLDLPLQATTWAGLNGDPSFFFGNQAQFQIFLRMAHVVNLAKLSDDPRLLDLAFWLCQSDNLHLLQWMNSGDKSEAEVSSYFTPGYWWNLGHSGIPWELCRVYDNLAAAIGHRLEARKPLAHKNISTLPPLAAAVPERVDDLVAAGAAG